MSYIFDSVQINNFILGVTNPVRQKVRVASTGNISLSACIAGTTMDEVELAVNDRVLLKNQTNLIENGVYRVQETDPLTRTDDLYDGEPFSGFLIVVQEGTINAAKMFACTNAKGVDVSATDELKFAEYAKLDATVNVVDGNIVTWQNRQLTDSGKSINDFSANFSIINSTINVNSTVTGTLSNFNYNNSLYSSLPSTGICSFWIDAPSSAAIYFDVHDGTSVLGSTVVPTTSGAGSYKFDFTRPSSDKLLSLRSKLQSLNIIGTNVYAAQFKF